MNKYDKCWEPEFYCERYKYGLKLDEEVSCSAEFEGISMNSLKKKKRYSLVLAGEKANMQ